MSNEVIIRKGRIKDKEELLEVWKKYMKYHADMESTDFEMIEDAPGLWMKFFKLHVRSRNKMAVVAEKDGKLVGYMLVDIQKRPPIFITTHQAHINDAAVIASEQNKGIGAKLLKHIEDWAREKGVKYTTLCVVPENDIGRNFWKKHGFNTIMMNQRKML